MIVNYTGKGWEVITQRAHGLLAAQIAQQWSKDKRPERWTELLIAIADHDDAQIELECEELLTPQGGPIDFKMKSFNLEHCTQSMDFSLSKSRYIALMCSMHLDFVYSDSAKTNIPARKFIAGQILLRKKLLKELKLKSGDANRDYRLLEWCDALSLLLCQRENQPESRSIQISNGPEDISYELVQTEADTLIVRPWPFENKSFRLYFETRLIPQLSFKDSGEFKSALTKAEVLEKVWNFKSK